MENLQSRDKIIFNTNIMFLSIRSSSYMLFFKWETDSIPGLVTGMIVAALLGLVFESKYLIDYRLTILHRQNGALMNKGNVKVFASRSLTHVIHVTIGYLLMLCIMTMNIWIFLSVIVGSALGFFLLRPWRYSKEPTITENISTVENGMDYPLMKESII